MASLWLVTRDQIDTAAGETVAINVHVLCSRCRLLAGDEVAPPLESWGSTVELSGPIEAVNLALRHLHYRSKVDEIGTEKLFLVRS